MEYKHEDDGSVTANDGQHTVNADSENAANQALLAAKAGVAAEYAGRVSNLTLMNKAALYQRMEANVSRLVVQQLKTPTKEGHKFVAFRSDNAAIQGLGTTEVDAKLALLEREKQEGKADGESGFDGLTVQDE